VQRVIGRLAAPRRGRRRRRAGAFLLALLRLALALLHSPFLLLGALASRLVLGTRSLGLVLGAFVFLGSALGLRLGPLALLGFTGGGFALDGLALLCLELRGGPRLGLALGRLLCLAKLALDPFLRRPLLLLDTALRVQLLLLLACLLLEHV